MRVSEALKRYVVDLVGASRRAPGVALGASPRASLALVKLAQALAAFDGETFVSPEHVQEIAVDALAHRLVPTPGPAPCGCDRRRGDAGSPEVGARPGLKRLLRGFRTAYRVSRWSDRRFTTAGRNVAAVTVASGILAIDTTRTVAYQVFALGLALLLCAWVLSWRWRPGFVVMRRLPPDGDGRCADPLRRWRRPDPRR